MLDNRLTFLSGGLGIRTAFEVPEVSLGCVLTSVLQKQINYLTYLNIKILVIA